MNELRKLIKEQTFVIQEKDSWCCWVSFLDRQSFGPDAREPIWYLTETGIWQSGHETDVPRLSPNVLCNFAKDKWVQ